MRKWWTRAVVAASVFVMCVSATTAWAQANRGRLIVTVTDMTGAVLPNATVVIAGLEQVTRAASVAPAQADVNGIATIANLAPGRYSVEASFPAFEKALLKEVRVRAGDNRQTIVLKLSGFSDSVSVGRDREEAASDRASAFGQALTREQIDALSDDETEMMNQLRSMAGPDAVIKVDSFEGQQLPPKSMIKSIRITKDQFAAENHYAGGISIDIVTQPGVGQLRTNLRTGFYDSALDGRNPLIDTRTPSQNRNYGGGVSGTLVRNKAGFSVNFSRLDSFQVPVAYAVEDGVLKKGNMNLRAPSNNWSGSGSVDYAVTKDQTLRFGVSRNESRSDNQGLGGFNYDPAGAFTRRNTGTTFRVQESGPLGRRFFTSTRLYVGQQTTAMESAFEGPTYVVIGSSQTGGAQQAGASTSHALLIGSDLDYIRGRHSVRMGIQIDGAGYDSDQRSNYFGTYTFVDAAALAAGTPRSFTKRVGDPNISYWNVMTGVYIQDDIKLRKNLTITPGLRYEVQTHVHNGLGLGPRVGLTWAPFKNGRTTLRGSAGVFYDWLGTGIYEQSLRIDGFRQREINIVNPSLPVDESQVGDSSTLPVNRYLLGDISLARTARYSAGLSHTYKKLGISLTYSESKGTGLLVGENLNAPVDGVRPDPSFANIIRAVSDGRSRQHSVSVDGNVNLGRTASGPAAAGGKLLDWRRSLYVYASYGYGRNFNNTDGAFSVPATGDLALEWGPAAFDTRHRGNISISTGALRNFSAQIGVNGQSAPSLNGVLSRDVNGDLIFNDRPAGEGRNSFRTQGQINSNAYFGYSFGLGRQTMAQSGGIMIQMNGGAISATQMAAQAAPRYRINISCQISNLTNHANYVGFANVLDNDRLPFLTPQSVAGVRRITFNMNLQF